MYRAAVIAAVLVASAAVCGVAVDRRAARPATGDDTVLVPGGRFRMGADDGFAYEGPAHDVTVSAFRLDRHEVTNAEFRRFVAATGYATDAERYGWSAVYDAARDEWERVEGADWRHPEGPVSSVDGRDAYPVVQVSWNDAAAYARWVGGRLPTEAEWERAARGGLDGAEYAWGDDFAPDGRAMANTRRSDDGFAGLAPVGSFPPNGYGLVDMTGNAWEWVADRYADDAYARSGAVDPTGPESGDARVIRGGSFLCGETTCVGFRVAARNKNTPDSASNNLGFRCARDAGAAR